MDDVTRRQAMGLAVAGAAAVTGAGGGTADASLGGASRSAQGETPALIARIEGRQSPDRQGLDRYTLQEIMQKFHVPGVSIAVIKDSDIHWAKAYGVADVKSGAAVSARTLFQAGSVSKPVTAMAFLKAAQQGRASLDADVNKLLKSW